MFSDRLKFSLQEAYYVEGISTPTNSLVKTLLRLINLIRQSIKNVCRFISTQSQKLLIRF